MAAAVEAAAALGVDGGEDTAPALGLSLRFDSSGVRDDPCEDGGEGGGVSIFDDPRVKVDVADDSAVVLGFLDVVYYVAAAETQEGVARAGVRTLEDAQTSADAPNVLPLAPIVDKTAVTHLEAGEVITDVKWVNLDFFSVAYSSGVVRVFSRDGKLRFEQVTSITHRNSDALMSADARVVVDRMTVLCDAVAEISLGQGAQAGH